MQRVEQLTGFPEMLDGGVSMHALQQPWSRGGVQLRDGDGCDGMHDRDKLLPDAAATTCFCYVFCLTEANSLSGQLQRRLLLRLSV